MKSLVSQPEGVRYLMDNRFLPEIAEALYQLDPVSLHEFFLVLD